MDLVPQQGESFQIRAQTYVPCIGRWILNYWTTRKVSRFHFNYDLRCFWESNFFLDFWCHCAQFFFFPHLKLWCFSGTARFSRGLSWGRSPTPVCNRAPSLQIHPLATLGGNLHSAVSWHWCWWKREPQVSIGNARNLVFLPKGPPLQQFNLWGVRPRDGAFHLRLQSGTQGWPYQCVHTHVSL